MTLAVSLLNPGDGLLPAFSRLDKQQAIEVGIVYGVFSTLCFVGSYYMIDRQLDIATWQLLAIAISPFISLILSGSVVRSFKSNSGSIATDIFIAGTTLAPLGLISLVIGFIPLSIIPLVLLLAIFGFSYTVLTLHAGCTQILNLREFQAAFSVALMLAISSWSSYLMVIFLSL